MDFIYVKEFSKFPKAVKNYDEQGNVIGESNVECKYSFQHNGERKSFKSLISDKEQIRKADAVMLKAETFNNGSEDITYYELYQVFSHDAISSAMENDALKALGLVAETVSA